jgi:hypothetical protein
LIVNQAEIVLAAGMALIGGFLEPRNRRIEILLDSFAGDVERAEGKLRGRGDGLAAFLNMSALDRRGLYVTAQRHYRDLPRSRHRTMH